MYDKRLGLLRLLSAASLFGSSFFKFARGQQPVPAPAAATTAPQPQKSILEIIDSTFSYQSLSNVISTAGLRDSISGAGPFTVFAPANGALAVIPNFQFLLTPGFYLHLRELALFHISKQGALLAADLADGLSIPMLNGQSVDVKNGQGLITLTTPDGAESIITQPDQVATNGVIHKISPALFPSFVFNNLADIAGTFFQELVVVAGMEDDIKTRPLTLLLPTTAALINVPSSTFTDPTLAAEFLKYHLIDGVYPSTLLPNGPLKTLQGEPVYVSVSADGSSVSFNGHPATEVNLLANNGIVHRVDSVLEPQTQGPTLAPGVTVAPVTGTDAPLPSLAEAVAQDESLSSFKSAIEASGYSDELGDRPPKVVFAPTNAAFDEAKSKALTGSFAGSEWIAHLQNLMQMHVTLDATKNVLTDGLTLQMLNGEIATVKVGSGGNASIAGPNGAGGALAGSGVTANNGVLYKIDGVLEPHWVSTDIVDVLKEDGMFNAFLELVSLAGLEGKLRSRKYTVLAPIDNAINQLDPSAISALKAPENVNQLKLILDYHVIPQILPSSQLQNGPVGTLANKDVTVQSSSSGNVQFDNVQVVEADILANNGLIYALNGVLDLAYIPKTTAPLTAAPVPAPSTRPPTATAAPDVPRVATNGSSDSSGTRPNATVGNVVIALVCLVVSLAVFQ